MANQDNELALYRSLGLSGTLDDMRRTYYKSNATGWILDELGNPVGLAGPDGATQVVPVVDETGGFQANVIHRTGPLASLLALTSPQGEIAMATDGANAGKLVSILTAGAKMVGGGSVAVTDEATPSAVTFATTHKDFVVTDTPADIVVTGIGFQPKAVLLFYFVSGIMQGVSFNTVAGGVLAFTDESSAIATTIAAPIGINSALSANDPMTMQTDGFTIPNVARNSAGSTTLALSWLAFG